MNTYAKRRIKTIEAFAQQDPIHQDYKNINQIKYDLLNGLLRRGDINYKKASINSVLNLSQNVMNQLKNNEPYHGIAAGAYNIDNIQNYADSLRGYQSKLGADEQDPLKLNTHLYRKLANPLISRIQQNVDYINGNTPKSNPNNIETWNHHYQDETNLIHKLEYQLDDKLHVDDFDQKYGKMEPYSVKYITAGNQTYYFPEKMLDLNGDSSDNPTLVPSLIDNRNNYEARYKRQERLVNNYWRQIKGMEVSHHWFNYDTHDTYMGNANYADGIYQYKTVHDKVWYQYYRDRIRNDKNSIKDCRNVKRDSKLEKRINALRSKIKYDRKHHNKKWIKLDNKYRALKSELKPLSNYVISKQANIKHNQRKANWWLNKINGRNKKFKDVMTQNLETWNRLGTIKNVRKDSRYTHFGYIRPRNPGSDHSYIYFKIEDESPTYTTQVNSTPSEWGVNATTGTTTQQTQVSVSGELFNINFSSLITADGNHGYFHNNSDDITNPDDAGESDGNNKIWRQYYGVMNDADTLSDWNQQGAEMFYSGQNWYPHCVISEFTPDYNNSGDDGSVTSISFSMTLTLCNYFQSNIKSRNKSAHNHGGKGRNHGKKSTKNPHIPYSVPVKQGYTYVGIAARYHVSVGKLKKLNHWASTRIPIYVHGKRNRIKLR